MKLAKVIVAAISVYILAVLSCTSLWAGVNEDLLHAVTKGDLKAVKSCFKNGADVNAKSARGIPALILAIGMHRIDIVSLLLAKGADVNARNIHGETALIGGNGWLPRYCVSVACQGADVNAKRKGDHSEGDHSTVLMLAVSVGYSDIVSLLLAKGADVNARDIDGHTALMTAAMLAPADVVSQLLAKGADVNAKSNNGETALMRASSFRRSDVVDLLKKAGARP